MTPSRVVRPRSEARSGRPLVLTAEGRHALEDMQARYGPARARFRSQVEVPCWQLYGLLRARRDEAVRDAVSSVAGPAPDGLARDVVTYLRACDWALVDALALCVAAGADEGVVEALLGPVLVRQSLQMLDDAAGRREHSYRGDTETLYGLLCRGYEEHRAWSLAALAAVAVGMTGSRLLQGDATLRARGSVAGLALDFRPRRAPAGAAARDDRGAGEQASVDGGRLLYCAALEAVGRPLTPATASFLDASFALEAVLGELGSTDVGSTLVDRFAGLVALVPELPPDFVDYAESRVAGLAEAGLTVAERLDRAAGEPAPPARGEVGGVPAHPARAPGPPLTVLMFGYCFFADGRQHLIGVYKRLVRIGMELVARGHRVHLVVPGRERYRDPLIDEAARTPSFSFVDLRLRGGGSPEGVAANLEAHRDCIRAVAPDVVVVGEGPPFESMLEATLAAAQCAVPVVIVDNLYSPGMVHDWVLRQAPVADALLLVGPSSHELRPVPPHVYYAPPFVPSSEALRGRLDVLLGGVPPAVTVLGYDQGVRRLGLGLARELGAEHGPVIVISADPGATDEEAAALGVPQGTLLAVPPLPENVLFALLRASRLAVVKGGFMQVTECLSLGTPVVALRYDDYSVEWLPLASKRLVISAHEPDPDAFVVRASRRVVETAERATGVHAGPLGGVAIAADCLEDAAAAGWRATTAECARAGVEPSAIADALRVWWSEPELELSSLRCTCVERSPEFDLYAAVAEARAGGEVLRPALAVWVFPDDAGASRHRAALPPDLSPAAHVDGRLSVEPWRGRRALRERRDWAAASVVRQ